MFITPSASKNRMGRKECESSKEKKETTKKHNEPTSVSSTDDKKATNLTLLHEGGIRGINITHRHTD